MTFRGAWFARTMRGDDELVDDSKLERSTKKKGKDFGYVLGERQNGFRSTLISSGVPSLNMASAEAIVPPLSPQPYQHSSQDANDGETDDAPPFAEKIALTSPTSAPGIFFNRCTARKVVRSDGIESNPALIVSPSLSHLAERLREERTDE